MATQGPGSGPAAAAGQLPVVNRNWVRVFGVAKEPWLATQGKSGYTPILPSTQDPWRNANTLHDLKCQAYQSIDLHCLTTYQLQLAGAINNSSHRPQRLAGILHPLFARANWIQNPVRLHVPLYTLPRGFPGNWTAHNDIVWTVLQPVLRLASQFMSHTDCFHWWDALLNATYVRINEPLAPAGSELYTFKRRNIQRQMRAARVNNIPRLQELAHSIAFHFVHGSADQDGMPSASSMHGQTIWDLENKRCFVRLAFEDYVPLLYGPTMPPEQLMMQQVHCATTLVHELAHCLFQVTNGPNTAEPYFEEEAVGELGNSMQNAIFGGDIICATQLRQTWYDRRHIPPLTLGLSRWPSEKDRAADDARQPNLSTFPAVLGGEIHPIQAGWLSDINQQEFWDHGVRRFGSELLHPPKTIVASWAPDSHWRARFSVPPLGNIRWSAGVQTDIAPGPPSPESLRILQQRMTRTAIIQAALPNLDPIFDVIDEAVSTNPDLAQLGTDIYAAVEDDEFHFDGRDVEDLMSTRIGRQPMGADQGVLLAFINQHHEALAISTMMYWIPINLFLHYINRHLQTLPYDAALPPRALFREETLRDFLRACRLQNAFFDYSLRGAGVVRLLANGASWTARHPPPPPPSPPNLTDEERNVILTIQEILEDIAQMSLWVVQNGDSRLRDIETEYVLDQILEQCALATEDSDIQDLTREELMEGLVNMSATHNRIIMGPVGITRRIDSGWSDSNVWRADDPNPTQHPDPPINDWA